VVLSGPGWVNRCFRYCSGVTFIRGIDKNYEVYEEFLDVHSIHDTTTGEDIFKQVENAVQENNLQWKNLKCITTDGGKNMCGKNKGVVALVSKAVENDGGSKPLIVHRSSTVFVRKMLGYVRSFKASHVSC
jgi:hypothetical protein